MQSVVECRHLVAHTGIEAGLNGDVQRQEAVLVVVLVQQHHVGIDDTADGGHVALEGEGGETMVLLVVDDVQIHIAVQCLLAGSGCQSQTEAHANHTIVLLGFTEGLRLLVIGRRTVVVEATHDTGDDQRVEAQR